MKECVTASCSLTVFGDGLGNADDAEQVIENCETIAPLRAHGDEDLDELFQLYTDIAAGKHARGDGSRPAVPKLHKAAAETNADVVSSSARVFEVSAEQSEATYMEATQKSLHDIRKLLRFVQDLKAEILTFVAPAAHNGESFEVKQAAVRKDMDAAIEQRNVNDSSSEFNVESNKDCDTDVESYGAINEYNNTVDAKVAAAVADGIEGAEENCDILSVIQGTSADLVAELHMEAEHVAKDTSNVDETPTQLVRDIQSKSMVIDNDDHGVVSKRGDELAGGYVEVAVEVVDASESFGTNHVVPLNKESSQISPKVTTDTELDLAARNAVFQTEFEGADLDVSNHVEAEQLAPALKIAVLANDSAGNISPMHDIDSVAKISYTFYFTGLNHVAFCVENLERALDFYCGLLGLKTSEDRPELPYRGAWLFLGGEEIHLMEVPNPDPANGRPAHGGFDRHACLNCKNVEGVRITLEKAGILYQRSMVPSIFTRDPDGNGLEFIEVKM